MSTTLAATTVTRAVLTVTTTVTSSTATSTIRAPPQGGILEGLNPAVYNPSNPLILFIIQAGIIITFCRLLHYPLSWLRQPRVIAEVIGGILLGPSVMGRIPNFTDTIFPTAAMPNLSLVATLGLVLFLFIVGLEVDLRWFAKNWRPAVAVSLAGMALPFALGCAIAWGLYNQFKDEPGSQPIAFPTFMLFIGVAMAITAFPVLCRILTELQLLNTPVGSLVLSAGVGNDVVGWILLALCVALVNAQSGLTALWVLLTCVGYALFLTFVVRPAFMKLLRHTGALENGPSQTIVAVTLLMMLTSAFFTGVIGVHPIFGAFMAGLICPHEGGFAIAVTEKVEDLVSAIFLPLYFALSGLSTNLGLLDNGITWAYVIAIIVIAFSAKFIGCSLAAKLSGLLWRESFTVGALMSCKGLVELIVLNIGLQAKILTQRTFTMFVVMALVTTFATTPLTSALYPPWYQRKLEAWKRGEINWDGTPGPEARNGSIDEITLQKFESSRVKRMLVYLRLDCMPTLLAFVSLLGGAQVDTVSKHHPTSSASSYYTNEVSTTHNEKRAPVSIHGVRLLELSERDSAVMKVSEVEGYTLFDPVLNAFRVLGRLYNLAISGEVAIAPESSYSETLVSKASEESSDLLLLPWSETGGMSEAQNISHNNARSPLAASPYQSFISRTLDEGITNVAVFINRGFGGSNALQDRPSALTRTRSLSNTGGPKEHLTTFPLGADRSHHIFVPFFGGADSRVALRLVLQLAENPDVTATVVHYRNIMSEDDTATGSVVHYTKDAISASANDNGTMSRSNQNSSWNSAAAATDDSAFFATLQRSLPAGIESRVHFETVATSTPLSDALVRAAEEMSSSSSSSTSSSTPSNLPSRNGNNIIVIPRRASYLGNDAAASSRALLHSLDAPAGGAAGGGVAAATAASACLGVVAYSMLERGLEASLLVVQAGVGPGFGSS